MDAIRQITELIEPTVRDLGFEVVRILMTGGQRPTVQVMVEPSSRGPMTVEDCARLSRGVSEILDAADPIAGEYTLEVSSPGIDRPLTRLKDFDDYAGLEARIELDRVAEGRKRFRGVLAGVERDAIGIDLEGEDSTAMIPFEWIVDAKLILTDALMKRGADERAARLSAEADQDTPE